MIYPYRENLEVVDDSAGKWVRCNRCSYVLCRLGEDWKEKAKKRTSSPTKAGALMGDLVGRYVLAKLYCPSCGALLDSDLVEETFAA